MSDAWSVWKDIGYPGTVHVPGPDGRPRVYTFTRADWERIVRTGKKKVRENWNIPTCWEHQDVAPGRVQLSRNPDRDLALGVFASIRDFSMTPDGRAKALVTGTDPDDYKQFEKVGYVSPEIAWDWRDSDGHVWNGPSVTHLAATPRPVQRHQNRVGESPDRVPSGLRVTSLEKLVRMSFSRPAKPSRVGPTLRLSLDHYRGGLAAGVKAMADEPEGTGASAKNPSPWERIAMALSAHCGIQLGDVTKINNPDEFARLVEVAAMNYKAGSEPEVPEEDDDLPPETEGAEQPGGDMEQPPEGAEPAPSPPVQMSLTEKKADDRIIEMERAGLVSRAERVRKNGALAPSDADAIVEECQTVRLSLTADKRLAPCVTITKLEAFEKVKPGATVPVKGAKGKAARLSQGVPRNTVRVDAPTYQENGEEDSEAVIAAFFATGKPRTA